MSRNESNGPGERIIMDAATVKRVARVARLVLTEKETEKFSVDLVTILKAFGELAKAGTEGVEPAFQPLDARNVMREDEVEAGLSQEEALSNTKNVEEGHFKGPKVV